MPWFSAIIGAVNLLFNFEHDQAIQSLPGMLNQISRYQETILKELKSLKLELQQLQQKAFINDMKATSGALASGLKIAVEQNDTDGILLIARDSQKLALKFAYYGLPAHQGAVCATVTTRLAYQALGDAKTERSFITEMRRIVHPWKSESVVKRSQWKAEEQRWKTRLDALRAFERRDVITEPGGGKYGWTLCSYEIIYTIKEDKAGAFVPKTNRKLLGCAPIPERDERWEWEGFEPSPINDIRDEEEIELELEDRSAWSEAKKQASNANVAKTNLQTSVSNHGIATHLVESVGAMGLVLK